MMNATCEEELCVAQHCHKIVLLLLSASAFISSSRGEDADYSNLQPVKLVLRARARISLIKFLFPHIFYLYSNTFCFVA